MEYLIIIRKFLIKYAWMFFLMMLLLFLLNLAYLLIKACIKRKLLKNDEFRNMLINILGIIVTVCAETISAPYTDHGYHLYKGDVSWPEAVSRCAQGEYSEYDSHLVCITDSAELDNIIEFLNNNETAKELKYVWIGAYLVGGPEGYYQWVDTELTWSESLDDYWMENEPSYTDKNTGAIESYLCLNKINGKWKLNDVNGKLIDSFNGASGSVGYLCEYADEK